jgi:SSS family solute:Na+ symporter
LAFLLRTESTLYLVLDKEGQQVERDFDMSGIAKPAKTVWAMWIALIVVMVGLYVFFNGH